MDQSILCLSISGNYRTCDVLIGPISFYSGFSRLNQAHIPDLKLMFTYLFLTMLFGTHHFI